MITISKAVSIRIKEILKEKNITQYRLAINACLSHETIKSIMKGKAKGVNLKTIIMIADGLKMNSSEFLNSPIFEFDNLEID